MEATKQRAKFDAQSGLRASIVVLLLSLPLVAFATAQMLISTPGVAQVAPAPQAPSGMLPLVLLDLARYEHMRNGAEGIVRLAERLESPRYQDQLYLVVVECLLGDADSLEAIYRALPALTPRPYPFAPAETPDYSPHVALPAAPPPAAHAIAPLLMPAAPSRPSQPPQVSAVAVHPTTVDSSGATKPATKQDVERAATIAIRISDESWRLDAVDRVLKVCIEKQYDDVIRALLEDSSIDLLNKGYHSGTRYHPSFADAKLIDNLLKKETGKLIGQGQMPDQVRIELRKRARLYLDRFEEVPSADRLKPDEAAQMIQIDSVVTSAIAGSLHEQAQADQEYAKRFWGALAAIGSTLLAGLAFVGGGFAEPTIAKVGNILAASTIGGSSAPPPNSPNESGSGDGSTPMAASSKRAG